VSLAQQVAKNDGVVSFFVMGGVKQRDPALARKPRIALIPARASGLSSSSR
jgi:hypothetical protein